MLLGQAEKFSGSAGPIQQRGRATSRASGVIVQVPRFRARLIFAAHAIQPFGE
jgi:hypothetical protein